MKHALRIGWLGLFVFALVFAAPVDAAKRNQRVAGPAGSPIADGIQIVEERTFLGVHMEKSTNPSGVRVTRVVRDSAAERAGMERGDVIVRIGDDVISGPKSLTASIFQLQPGDRTSITVVRDVEETVLDAEMGKRQGVSIRFDGSYTIVSDNIRGTVEGEVALDEDEVDSFLENTYVCRGEGCEFTFGEPRWYKLDCVGERCPQFSIDYFGRPVLGVELVQTTRELRQHLGSEDAGALVGKVMPGSPAERAGVQVGDLIVSIDGVAVDQGRDIRRALADTAGSDFDVEVVRDGRSVMLSVQMPEVVQKP